AIPDATLDFVISTMVLEHISDEAKFLDEIQRVLKPGGKAYITTVFKRRWAWYFRRREGKTVLDTSHFREYKDLDGFTALLMRNCRFSAIVAIELTQLWFPLVDPLLFRVVKRPYGSRLSRFLYYARLIKVPIPGYYTLSVIVQR
ncbi:MAG: class I SAM-dependent methyltransferase, partial [Anaerolineaceae bacterium]|nr:class I SAM-dependent methyltransferase [Anaerolineaceae bacterium]